MIRSFSIIKALLLRSASGINTSIRHTRFSSIISHYTGFKMVNFEQIKGNLETSMTYLKSTEDFTTQEATDALTTLMTKVKEAKETDAVCQQVGDFLVANGFICLVIKILKSLTSASEDAGFKSREALSRTICNIAVVWKKKICTPIRQDFIESGLIRALCEDLDSCDPDSQNPKQRIRIQDNLFRLQNFVLTPGPTVPEYRDQGAITTLMKYVKSKDKNTQVFSLRVLACIVNEEESQAIAAGGCMTAMINMLRESAEAEDRRYRFSIKTDEEEREFTTTLLTLTEGIVNLSSNDANKTAILFNGGIPVLSTILKGEYTDNQKYAAAEALWKMSFVDSVKDIILSHLQDSDPEALKNIKDMRSSNTPKLRDVSKGLLHQLGLLEIHEETPEEKASDAPSTEEECDIDAPHIMISYQWDFQERALQVRDKLRAKGYNVWMDVDKMEGNILMAMANAVEKAEVILMCVSRSYKASANCQTEANYSYKLKKDIIPLIVEKGYDADGWLGALIAMKLYARAYDDGVFEKDMAAVMREIGNRGKKP